MWTILLIAAGVEQIIHSLASLPKGAQPIAVALTQMVNRLVPIFLTAAAVCPKSIGDLCSLHTGHTSSAS